MMTLIQLEAHCAHARSLGAGDSMEVTFDDAAILADVSVALGEVNDHAVGAPETVRPAAFKLAHAV